MSLFWYGGGLQSSAPPRTLLINVTHLIVLRSSLDKAGKAKSHILYVGVILQRLQGAQDAEIHLDVW